MVVGIPWCREENYSAFRAMFEDRNQLPLSWAEFANTAQKAERLYRSQGEIVERVYIDPDEFLGWCAENGYGVNTRSRVEFAYRIAIGRHPDKETR